jgi:predicted nucleic acid-binding protein
MGFPPIVILDACVLYPAALRDLLMRMAVHDLISARWSEKIHEEWMTAVLRSRPDLRRSQLERTRQLMDLHGGDCLVTDYEKHIEGLILPDPDDRHVLAAAMECGADAIVTWNLSDFPAVVLDTHSVALWTPDDLMVHVVMTDPDLMLQVLREHREPV